MLDSKFKNVKILLQDVKVMQLATSIDDQPWIVNLYFVVDNKARFYWLSEKTTRHSKDIENNSKISISAVIKQSPPVIGLQVAGEAKEIGDIKTIAKVMPGYIAKYGKGKDFLQLFKKGSARHRLYELTPNAIQLFDELNYKPSDNPLQLL